MKFTVITIIFLLQLPIYTCSRSYTEQGLVIICPEISYYLFADETMEDWDEDKLEEVVAKKHGETNKSMPKTAIVSAAKTNTKCSRKKFIIANPLLNILLICLNALEWSSLIQAGVLSKCNQLFHTPVNILGRNNFCYFPM